MDHAGAVIGPLFAFGLRVSWSSLHGRLKAMMVAAGLLALASVPEVFVVLWARQSGMEVRWVPLVWDACRCCWPAGVLA